GRRARSDRRAEPVRKYARARDRGAGRRHCHDGGRPRRGRSRAADAEAGPVAGVDAARAEPRGEGCDRGSVPAGDPSRVHVGRAAGAGGLGVSRSPGGRGVPADAGESQRRQDPDRMAARLAAAGVALALAAACRGERRSAAVGRVAAPETTARSDTVNLYAAAGANRLSPRAAQARPLVYVPNSKDGTVTVIDARTYRVLRTFPTGALPQHVVPAYDLTTLWVANNLGGTLTPIDPTTGQEGASVPVDDPYNLYFTPDGRFAIVVAERRRRLDFRDAHTLALVASLPVQCRGVDHMEFTADGRSAVATCEFSGQLLKLDLATRQIVGYLLLDPDGLGPRAMPQDIRAAPDGRVFYVADMMANGVFLVDPVAFRRVGFIATGKGTHGIYPSRDGRLLDVS